MATCSAETSVSNYNTARCRNPDDRSVNSHRQNLNRVKCEIYINILITEG